TRLVVEPARRHVAHNDRGQRADVDSSFERRGDRQHVEVMAEPLLLLLLLVLFEEDPLEAHLSALGFKAAGLPGEFRTVQAESAVSCSGSPSVVVLAVVLDRARLVRQRCAATGADASASGQVLPEARGAVPR